MPREHQQAEPTALQRHTSTPPFVSQRSPLEHGDPSVVYARAFGGEEPTVDEEEVSFEEVDMPLPSARHSDRAVEVKTDRAPTAEQMLDPDRPDLSRANADVVKSSTQLLVDNIYQHLYESLGRIEKTLARTAPPPETPFALKLIGWAVENITTFAIGQIGKLAADELFKSTPIAANEPPLLPAIPRGASRQVRRKAQRDAEKARKSATKPKSSESVAAEVPAPSAEHGVATKIVELGAAKGGRALGDRIASPPPPTSIAADDVQSRAAPGESLLVEFVTRQKGALLGRKVNAITMLDMIQTSAARHGMVALHDRLGAVLASGKLTGWFTHKVTMEWLNFVARASLGPRDAGQTTEMIGANSIGGIAAGGANARQQWVGGDGFVEITLTTPDLVHGLKGVTLQGTKIPSSVGATDVLRDIGDQTAAGGAPYSLAALPVYRRVWIQTGSSKLTVAPAFVITPDGSIEADLSNPALAAIGAGRPVELGEHSHLVGGVTKNDASDEQEWVRGLTTATSARAGAYMVCDMLRGIKPGGVL